MDEEIISAVYSINSAARKIGVSPAAIRYWIATGRLSATFEGDRYHIAASDLHAANEVLQSVPQGRPRGSQALSSVAA